MRERERENIHRVRQKVCVGIVTESPTAQALSWQKKKSKSLSLYLSLTPNSLPCLTRLVDKFLVANY